MHRDREKRARPGSGALLLAALLFGGCAGPSGEPSAAPDPEVETRNVVVILADTLRAGNLGAWGHHRDTSPNLAALAEEGFLFEDVRAQAPCTYPSANSLLTGLDGTRFWVQEGDRIGIPEETPSLAEILADRGWTTVAVSASPIVRKTPSDVNRYGGFDRGFDLFDESCLWNDARCVNRRASSYLRGVREPFFLFLHYMDPHDPFVPPSRRFSKDGYEGKEFVMQGDPNPLVDVVYGEQPPRFEVTQADLDHLEALYDDEIAFFDAALGRLIEELEGRGLLDQTLVAVVSDHGEEFLEHGHVKHCHSLYDTEIHTPIVLRIPGERGGRRIPRLAQNLDLVPTILDYLGVESETSFDGRSLRPLVEEGSPVHERVFSAYGSLRAVVSEEHKLIVDLHTKEVELYDRASDPGETRDVARDHPEVARELQRALSRWIRDTEGASSEEEALRRGREAAERLRALGYVK